MEEKALSSSLGVQKRKPTKRINRKRLGILRKAIDYLKSDTYMFAPLVSSQPLDFSEQQVSTATASSGEESKRSCGGKDGKKLIMRQAVEYLKTDCYMYSSLVSPLTLLCPASSVRPPPEIGTKEGKALASHHEQLREKIKEPPLGVGTNLVGKEGSRCSELSDPVPGRSVIKKTMVHREMVKHMVHHNCRSSSASGLKKGRHGAARKKIAVD